jgi:hypothetical protein
MEAANSLGNQKIKAKFVERHVYAKVNTLVEFVLANPDHNPPFTWDDVCNAYYYEDWTGQRYNAEERQEKLEEYDLLIDQLTESIGKLPTYEERDHLENLVDARHDLRSATWQRIEVIEWWLVSDWLAEKLTAHGQPTVSDGNSFYWGRTISGQAIKMDEVIHIICEDLQILEGQTDQWQL